MNFTEFRQDRLQNRRTFKLEFQFRLCKEQSQRLFWVGVEQTLILVLVSNIAFLAPH
jgi:hypothetical protein